METKRCSSCSRGPQANDQFLDKFGRTCTVCLKCRLKTQRLRKPEKHPVCTRCDKRPTFNFPGNKRGVFCADHKEPGMVNVKSMKCEHDDCNVQPCFNFPEELFGRFCATHRREGMVNLRERPCENEGCSKKPNFNTPGEIKARFCKEHALEGMTDVLCDKCSYEGCKLRAHYNIWPSKKGERCFEHRTEVMINVKTAKCIKEGCFTVPVFGLPGSKRGVYCRDHKSPEMIDVMNPRCKTPMCDIIMPGNKKGYCARCSVYMFPDQPVGARFKTREMAVRDFLRKTWPDCDITHDKRVDCHACRPDFVFDLGSHTIVIEIDENQHRSYDTSCDNKRLMSIFQGLGGRPMVMIRFNPDSYAGHRGCWTKDNELVDDGRPWAKRLGTLEERIEFWFDNEPDRELSVEHLFFDGY